MDQPRSIFRWSEGTALWRRATPYALLLGITAALYASSLWFDFVWDDGIYIQRDLRIQSLSWRYLKSIWTMTWLGHYAPVHNTVLALLYRVWGLHPFGYHLAQLLLHAACVALVFLLLRKMESEKVALLASLMFVVHPSNIETVAWVSETKSTLALLFFLLSFLFFIRLREQSRTADGILAGFSLTLSILAKINTVVGPVIFLLYDYKQGATLKTLRWRSLAAFFSISAIFTVVHLASFHGSVERLETSYNGSIFMHVQNLPFLIWFYVQLAVWPFAMSAVEQVRVYNTFAWQVAAAWVAMLLVVLALLRANRDTQFWALWFVVSLLPVLQIVPNTIWVADRYLYVPLIGLAVLWSYMLFWIAERLTANWKLVCWEAAMGGVLLAFAWETRVHLPIWRNDLSLWTGTIDTCQNVSYCHLTYGQTLMTHGRLQRGGEELVRAVEMEPSPLNLLTLGDALSSSARNYPEAIRMYEAGLKAAQDPRSRPFPSLVVALYAKLASAHVHLGQLQESERALGEGKRIDPNDLNLVVVEAFLRWKQGNLKEARRLVLYSLYTAGNTMKAEELINMFWGNPEEVHQMVEDLRSQPQGDSSRWRAAAGEYA